MPYIDYERRLPLSLGEAPETVGELNYVITRVCCRYLGGRQSYTLFNEVIGVLTCVIQEMYRRMVAPYEDRKIEENGDVFP